MWQSPAPRGFRAVTTIPVVAAQLLAWVSATLCRHRFSWPHNSPSGRDYQVCVLCGAAYEYDWSAMRRTHRLASSPATQPNAD